MFRATSVFRRILDPKLAFDASGRIHGLSFHVDLDATRRHFILTGRAAQEMVKTFGPGDSDMLASGLAHIDRTDDGDVLVAICSRNHAMDTLRKQETDARLAILATAFER